LLLESQDNKQLMIMMKVNNVVITDLDIEAKLRSFVT